MSNPLAQTHDGVGMVCRGNLALILYAEDARLHRTRWLFDRLDELLARNPEGIYVLMVVAPTAGPPDAATRTENAVRTKHLGSSLLTLVTVPLGDDFRVSIVRTVMRALVMLSGQSSRHHIAATEHDGLELLLLAAKGSPRFPSRSDIVADLAALHTELDPRTT